MHWDVCEGQETVWTALEQKLGLDRHEPLGLEDGIEEHDADHRWYHSDIQVAVGMKKDMIMKRLCTRNVSTLTNTDCSGDVTNRMSTRRLEEVYRWSERAQRQYVCSDHTARAGWADSTHMLQNTSQPSTTAAHAACSTLAQPIPIVPFASSCRKRLLHQARDQH